MDGQSPFPEHLFFSFQTVLEKLSWQYQELYSISNKTSKATSRDTVNKRNDKNYSDRLAILVIRNEHKWNDYVAVNQWLMVNQSSFLAVDGAAQTPDSPSSAHRLVTSELKPFRVSMARQQIQFQVTKNISTLGRTRLCRALRDEYMAYLELLRRSLNLSPSDKNESLEFSRQNCPDLDLLQRVVFE